MRNFKINGESKSVPTSWDDVSFGLMVKLAQAKDELETIALFLGIDVETLRSAKEVENFYLIKDALQFLNKECPRINNSFLDINGSSIELPADLLHLVIGQFEDMRLIAGQEGVPAFEVYRQLVSIFIQPFVQGEKYSFEESQKPDMLSQVDALPAPLVLGMSGFFLNSLKGLTSGTNPSVKRWAILKRKTLQAFQSWRYTALEILSQLYVKIST